MLIGSIDVGTVNLAFAVLNTDSNTVVHMELIALSEVPDGGRTPFGDLSVVPLIAELVRQRAALFRSCTIVALEKQMIRKMIIVQFVLEATLVAAGVRYVVQVPPRNVKAFLGTSRGSHARNKKAAIAKLRSLLGDASTELLDVRFPRKQDDVADAVLQAIYVGANYQKVLRKWKHARRIMAPEDGLKPTAKKRRRGKKRKS